MATERKRVARPAVAVDTALLTVSDGVLNVLQVRRDGERGWSLPGGVLRPGERLAEAVRRSLHEKVGLDVGGARQLQVLDEPDELTVAYGLIVPADTLADRLPSTRLASADAPGRLPASHAAIIALAVADVRRRYAELPDPDGLLPARFTVLDLRRVHEAVAGEPLQKDTFRRAMDPHLTGTGGTSAGVRGRPAELFSRRR